MKEKLLYNKKLKLFFLGSEDLLSEEHITDKIAVHCPTEEDRIFVKSKINHISDFHIISDFYNLKYRGYDNKGYYKGQTTYIIAIDEFKELYEPKVGSVVLEEDVLSDKDRTFDTGSKRDNDDNKPLVNHLDSYVRLRFGYHLRKGANHYGKNNWKLGQPTETAIESLNRHLALYENGCRKEDHLSAIIFNVQLIMKNEEKDGIEFNHYFKK